MGLGTNNEFVPYSWTQEYNLTVTSANSNQQLMRASWPLNLTAKLLSIRITNTTGDASGGQVVLWDQDLSNTTPATRGSAGGFLAIFGVGAAGASGVAATTIEYGREGGGTTPDFNAGIAVQASRLNTHISIQVLHHY